MEGSMTDWKCDGFYKFATFFLLCKIVLVKTNNPKHRKKMEFMEFFEERCGVVAANDKQPQDGN